MTEDVVAALVQEIHDLLDVGRVGLYEFMWELNTSQSWLSIDERRAVARQALDQILADPAVRLIWERWADPEAGVRTASIEDVGIEAWNDIGDDGLYLAINRGHDG